MRTIPAALITEKNKPQSAHPWIVLIEVELDASTWAYYTNYDAIYEYFKKYHDDWTGDRDEIVFPHPGGSSYVYLPFHLGILKETSTGQLDSLEIRMDNSERQMEAYLHSYDLVGNQIIVRLANLNYMTDSQNQITDYFEILTIVSGRVVTFVLGHRGLINKRFGRTISRSCVFRFQDSYCGFAGSSQETCKRILGSLSDSETCRGKANEASYGGFVNARGFIK